MPNVVILAGTYVEGRKFAAAVGLKHPIVPARSDSMLGVRADIVLEFPSYVGRRDRFVIEQHLARSARLRPVVRMFVDPRDFLSPAGPAPAGAGEMPGQITIEEALLDPPARVAQAVVDSDPKVAALAEKVAAESRYRVASKAKAKGRSRG